MFPTFLCRLQDNCVERHLVTMEGLVWKLATTGHVIVSLDTRTAIVRQVGSDFMCICLNTM